MVLRLYGPVCGTSDTGKVTEGLWAPVLGLGRESKMSGHLPDFQSDPQLGDQSIKNLPAMQESRVRFLGWEDPLEKEMATHSSILAWRIPWKRSLAGYSLWGHKRWT